ncbi:GntR family transcriptional regulator [Bengtsoniella intestinalis]|uniref:GntR family transcriptional regulator n=1 Tax=Bengtsoniella intestinalis TaxID=3073143 RepID=UPI00391F813D
MVNFSGLTLTEGPPIYLQITTYVKRGMVGGTICHGDELPSRRVLSVQLGVNPNTIQKAYRLLEENGLLTSHAGSKSYIQTTPQTIATLRQELLEAELSAMVSAVKAMGTTKEEALTLLSNLWEETL